MFWTLLFGAVSCVLELLTGLTVFGYVATIAGLVVVIYTIITWNN